MIKHNIKLMGSGTKGTRVSGATLRQVLDVFVDGSKRALRFRSEGRSVAPGNDPAWLLKAADFEFIGLANGSTVICIESTAIQDAAPEKLLQIPMWNDADPNRSAFQMFEEALIDAISGKADSDHFDDGLLTTCAQLSSIFDRGIESIEITNGSRQSPKIVVAPADIEQVTKLRKQIPPTQMAKVSGKMDMIRHSDKAFELVLDSGETIRGIAQNLDAEQLGPWYGKRVLITGKAVFRPSGGILRIEATKIDPVEGTAPAFWAKAPRPIAIKFDERRFHKAQSARSGMNKVFGAWPGDETEEDIDALMR